MGICFCNVLSTTLTDGTFQSLSLQILRTPGLLLVARHVNASHLLETNARRSSVRRTAYISEVLGLNLCPTTGYRYKIFRNIPQN
jgi:hypothetical protein